MIEFELMLLIDEFEATTAKETNTNSFYSIILGFNYSLSSALRRTHSATDDVYHFMIRLALSEPASSSGHGQGWALLSQGTTYLIFIPFPNCFVFG